MDNSVPRVTVWHHSAEPPDAKTMTLGTDLSIRTSRACQIFILRKYQHKRSRYFLKKEDTLSNNKTLTLLTVLTPQTIVVLL